MVSYQKYDTKKGQRWLFQTYVKNPVTGVNERVTRRGFLKQGEAKRAFEKFEEEMNSGKNVLSKITFEEVVEEYFAEEIKKVKESTLAAKTSKFKRRILPRFAKLLIDEISDKYCQKFIEDLEKEMKSARDYGIQLNLVFKFAKRKRYIKENPMEYVVYTKTRDESGEDADESFDGYWSKEIIEKFLEIAETQTNLRNFTLFRLALFTGARKGELLALCEEDLLEETREINIRKTLYWGKGGYKLLTPKTKKSIRKVPVDEETWDLLKKLILANKKARIAVGMSNKLDHKFIFVRDEFRPLRMAYPNETLESLCRRFKFTQIKFHGLRHSHASMLFAAGARMKEVQERLGHSTIDVTMNIYTHITDEVKEDVQNKFLDYMSKDNSRKHQEELLASKQHQK